MANRCPTAKLVGASELKGFKLLFRGGHGSAVATIEPSKDSKVPVLIWEITATDEKALIDMKAILSSIGRKMSK